MFPQEFDEPRHEPLHGRQLRQGHPSDRIGVVAGSQAGGRVDLHQEVVDDEVPAAADPLHVAEVADSHGLEAGFFGELPSHCGRQRFPELDPNQNIYLHCKSGVRSLKALKFLREQGFKYVKSVKGGISAWSDEIDHNVPKY